MLWIDVKEHLPPLDTDVLVMVKEVQKKYMPYDSRMLVAHLYERMLSKHHETEESRKDILRWNIVGTVLYWMLLPGQPERLSEETSKDDAIV
jgi:hypothetical protein